MKNRNWDKDFEDITIYFKEMVMAIIVAIGYILILLFIVPIRTIGSLMIIITILIFGRKYGSKVASVFDKILEPFTGFIDR